MGVGYDPSTALHVLDAIHYALINIATTTFQVCYLLSYCLMVAVYYTVYALGVVTKLFVTTSFSLFEWVLHILVVCATVFFHFVSYSMPIFAGVGHLTRYFLEKLLHVESLPHPFPFDAMVGAVVTVALMYGLVRGSIRLVAQLRVHAGDQSRHDHHNRRQQQHHPEVQNRPTRLPAPRSKVNLANRTDPVVDEPSSREDEDGESRLLKSELERVKLQRLCVVCLDGQKEVVLNPCRHLCACSVCAPELDNCPICRRPVQRWERIYDA
eukprot:Em0016g221a